MKEAYLRKVEARLARATELLADEERLTRLVKRVDPSLRSTDVRNRVADVQRVMNVDLPAVIAEVRALKISGRERS